VALVVLVDELLEVGEFLGGEDEGFGMDAGFEGVHGGSGLTCDRVGPVDFWALPTIRFYLTKGGHRFRLRPSFARIGRRKRLPHLEISSADGGIRGANGGKWLKILGEGSKRFVSPREFRAEGSSGVSLAAHPASGDVEAGWSVAARILPRIGIPVWYEVWYNHR